MHSFYLLDEFERQILFFVIPDGVESVSDLPKVTANNYRANEGYISLARESST